MIKSIHFQNFKALRDATLPLGPFTLIVGPNGSGKSTALQALKFVIRQDSFEFERMLTAGLDPATHTVGVTVMGREDGKELTLGVEFQSNETKPRQTPKFIPVDDVNNRDSLRNALSKLRIFSFDAKRIVMPSNIDTKPELESDGFGLPNVLDDLSDQEPERFEALNIELHRWLPEFDRILFERASNGMKGLQLRTSAGHYKTSARDLSQGTIIAVALLTLAHLKEPPTIVCLEEPDHGIHPRLLLDIRDAMYRLAFPEDYGEKRPPVQVIATTHSPYLLDLYKEHPEEIVIAHKDQDGVHFERLSEKPHISELLEGAPLGDIWYSGVL